MNDQQFEELIKQVKYVNGNMKGIGIILLGILVCFVILLLKLNR